MSKVYFYFPILLFLVYNKYREGKKMWFAKSGIVWHLACYQWLVRDEQTTEWMTETDVHASIIGRFSMNHNFYSLTV